MPMEQPPRLPPSRPRHPASRIRVVARQTPWVVFSLVFHAGVIAIAGVARFTLEFQERDKGIILVSDIVELPPLPPPPVKLTDARLKDALSPLHTELSPAPAFPENFQPKTPENELLSTSTEEFEPVIAPEIIAIAEVGDHFETINPDRPDTRSAFGNPDAQSFHSAAGSDDDPGGGRIGSPGRNRDRAGGIAENANYESLIGIGGSDSFIGAGGDGTGGWGIGEGTGSGVQSGAGHGTFGMRNGGGRRLMVRIHGGSKATEGAVDAALRWLANNQSSDGRWDSAKYGSLRKCDTAMTAFALLAFLGAGHTERAGAYMSNVQRGLAWLRKSQREDGRVFAASDTKGTVLGYSHAIAGLALAEAAGMGGDPETREAAQRAVNWSTHWNGDAAGGEGPWRYNGACDSGEADISVTGWYIMQLKAAKVSGLDVPESSLRKAADFVRRVETKRGSNELGAAREYYYQTDHKKSTTPRRGAIGVLCRQFLGHAREETAASTKHFMDKGGAPDRARCDLYYWYYGTLSSFQQGGDVWSMWNEAMKSALVETQAGAGKDAGSWNPAGDYSKEWGRVGQTALSALCLEVYYRYRN